MELVLHGDIQRIITVSDNVFGYRFNEGLIHQVITAYSASRRQGSKAQKSRSQVSGSGKKPWRQKGTGRARVGSIRSPIWRSGGVTFAAKPRNYAQKVNKKMYRAALKSILSELIRQNRLVIFKEFIVKAPKTKTLLQQLSDLQLKEVLIVIEKKYQDLYLASRNLYKVKVQEIGFINPISLLKFKKIIITVAALRKLEEILE